MCYLRWNLSSASSICSVHYVNYWLEHCFFRQYYLVPASSIVCICCDILYPFSVLTSLQLHTHPPDVSRAYQSNCEWIKKIGSEGDIFFFFFETSWSWPRWISHGDSGKSRRNYRIYSNNKMWWSNGSRTYGLFVIISIVDIACDVVVIGAYSIRMETHPSRRTSKLKKVKCWFYQDRIVYAKYKCYVEVRLEAETLGIRFVGYAWDMVRWLWIGFSWHLNALIYSTLWVLQWRWSYTFCSLFMWT